MREFSTSGHSRRKEVDVADRNSSRRVRGCWFLVTALLVGACTSKQVPIGQQNGSGGVDGGAPGSGGSGTTGAGGGSGGAGATGGGGGLGVAAGAGGGGGSGGSGGASGAGGSSGATGAGGGGTDAAVAIDAGSCASMFESAIVKTCTTAADCELVR